MWRHVEELLMEAAPEEGSEQAKVAHEDEEMLRGGKEDFPQVRAQRCVEQDPKRPRWGTPGSDPTPVAAARLQTITHTIKGAPARCGVACAVCSCVPSAPARPCTATARPSAMSSLAGVHPSSIVCVRLVPHQPHVITGSGAV